MTVQAAANQPVLVKIPPQAEMVGSQIFENAVVVKTTAAVTAVMVNEKPTAADSAVIIPVHRWGTEYHVVIPQPRPHPQCPVCGVCLGSTHHSQHSPQR